MIHRWSQQNDFFYLLRRRLRHSRLNMNDKPFSNILEKEKNPIIHKIASFPFLGGRYQPSLSISALVCGLLCWENNSTFVELKVVYVTDRGAPRIFGREWISADFILLRQAGPAYGLVRLFEKKHLKNCVFNQLIETWLLAFPQNNKFFITNTLVGKKI